MDTLFLELQKLLEIYGEYGSAEEGLKKFKKNTGNGKIIAHNIRLQLDLLPITWYTIYRYIHLFYL